MASARGIKSAKKAWKDIFNRSGQRNVMFTGKHFESCMKIWELG